MEIGTLVVSSQGRELTDRSNKILQAGISHDWAEETPEAKARWFQSLSMEERMDLLCAWTDMLLAINPRLMDEKDAEPVEGRILVLSQLILPNGSLEKSPDRLESA